MSERSQPLRTLDVEGGGQLLAAGSKPIWTRHRETWGYELDGCAAVAKVPQQSGCAVSAKVLYVYMGAYEGRGSPEPCSMGWLAGDGVRAASAL